MKADGFDFRRYNGFCHYIQMVDEKELGWLNPTGFIGRLEFTCTAPDKTDVDYYFNFFIITEDIEGFVVDDEFNVFPAMETLDGWVEYRNLWSYKGLDFVKFGFETTPFATKDEAKSYIFSLINDDLIDFLKNDFEHDWKIRNIKKFTSYSDCLNGFDDNWFEDSKEDKEDKENSKDN